MKNIIKLSLASLLATSLYAGEFQIGTGSMELKGGFIGLDKTINDSVMSYSLIEQHKNMFSSSWFYKYNFTWYDSNDIVNSQQTVNGGLPNSNIPSIDYRPQGLDLNVVLGKDLSHTDENNYFGAGIMLGVSLPWIDSKKDSNNNDSTSDNAMDAMEKSKTEMMTYKIGPSITARKSLNKYFTIYGSATYAYQTGNLKNSYAKVDTNVDGIFQEYDAGIRFQPVSSDYDMGWITLSPRLYATMGYRYTSWEVNDVAIDVTGTNTTFNKSDLTLTSSVAYFGLGYSF